MLALFLVLVIMDVTISPVSITTAIKSKNAVSMSDQSGETEITRWFKQGKVNKELLIIIRE